MKKLLLLALVAFVMSAGVAIAGDYETSDPTIRKYMWYGETSAGAPVKVQVGTDGKVVTSGGGGGDSFFTETADGAYLDGDLTVSGKLGATSVEVTGSGEGVLTMDDSASTAHELTIGTDDKIYIDDVEYASGATTDGGAITYVTSVTDDFAIGGTSTAAAFYFDESLGGLDMDGELTTGGNAVINFTDVDEYAELQIDGTKLADLTTGEVIFTDLTDGDDLSIGVDLTVDGDDIYFKGVKLN